MNAGGGGTAPAATGTGGTAPAATGAGGSGEAWFCAPGEFDDRPECCTVADHMPCKGLPEAECGAREYCARVKGVPWDAAWDGSWDDPYESQMFVGCYSFCYGHNAASTCVYHPSDPQTCFRVISGMVPDGWTEFSDCKPPPGLCGTSP